MSPAVKFKPKPINDHRQLRTAIKGAFSVANNLEERAKFLRLLKPSVQFEEGKRRINWVIKAIEERIEDQRFRKEFSLNREEVREIIHSRLDLVEDKNILDSNLAKAFILEPERTRKALYGEAIKMVHERLPGLEEWTQEKYNLPWEKLGKLQKKIYLEKKDQMIAQVHHELFRVLEKIRKLYDKAVRDCLVHRHYASNYPAWVAEEARLIAVNEAIHG